MRDRPDKLAMVMVTAAGMTRKGTQDTADHDYVIVNGLKCEGKLKHPHRKRENSAQKEDHI